MTEVRIEDRLAISDLMNGWIHRDLGEWDQLRELFHTDGTIEISWFQGTADAFVEGSRRMGEVSLRSKHLIGNPVITFHEDKALVETNAVLAAENVELGLGCATHLRFWDRVDKRDGGWRIVHRQAVYDMGAFTFPVGIVADVDEEVIAKYPREYAALAYLLERSGYPLDRVYATRGSGLEQEMKSSGHRWLTGS